MPRTWDDIGNAHRLADHQGHAVRWLVDAERWAAYDGTRWAIEGGNTALANRVLATIEALPTREAPLYDATPGDTNPRTGEPRPSQRDAFLAFVAKQRMVTRIRAMTELARGLPALHARIVNFDKDPMLLNCSNGIVDLRTGQLRRHDPDLWLMHQTGVEWDEDAPAPEWLKFLETVMPEDEVRDYLARIAGYTLTGSIEEQAIFIHHGTGANGKSVFLRVMRAVLGSYGQTVPRTTLLAKRDDGIPNDVARMQGKRLLITSETAAGRRIDDELVKQLTGGEDISARYMRGEFFDFQPVGKIHLMTNYLPHVGSGYGIGRRLQDVGWDVTIPEEHQDKRLAERIVANELSGVLAWAVRGALEWQRRGGLDVPETVRAKTAEHIRDADPLAGWLEERVGVDPGNVTLTHLLYLDYRAWTEGRGERPMTEKSFSAGLTERGYKRARSTDASRRSVFLDVKLQTRAMEGVAEWSPSAMFN